MLACEARQDFSFIYSTAARSTARGRCWRPIEGDLPAVLLWHTFGDGQKGVLSEDHLELQNMWQLDVGPMTLDARNFVEKWAAMGRRRESCPLWDSVFLCLCDAGFSGCGERVEVTNGYFFPQVPLPPLTQVTILAAAGVRWGHGAPGIVVTLQSSRIQSYFCVGVFVGQVPAKGITVRVG
jgi:hypothetical protein